MLKFIYEGSNCGSIDDINDTELDGCCPNCHEHHGEVSYCYKGTTEDFLDNLAKMSVSEISRKAFAIQIATESLLDK